MSGIKARLLAEEAELTRKLAECRADLDDIEVRDAAIQRRVERRRGA